MKPMETNPHRWHVGLELHYEHAVDALTWFHDCPVGPRPERGRWLELRAGGAKCLNCEQPMDLRQFLAIGAFTAARGLDRKFAQCASTGV